MNKAAIIVAVSMLLSRVLGIFREMLLAHAAGVSLEKNALDLAFMIPDILNHVVSTGFLSIIFIPIFTGYKVAGDEKAGWKFFSNVLNTFGLALLILVIPAFIWMKELIALLTVDGVTPELLERATYYGRIILPGQIFIFVGSILVAVQHTRKQFLILRLRDLFIMWRLSAAVQLDFGSANTPATITASPGSLGAFPLERSSGFSPSRFLVPSAAASIMNSSANPSTPTLSVISR